MADTLISGTTLIENQKRGEIIWRGEVAAVDFSTGDFTTDGATHELDLSGILPTNAGAVIFTIAVVDGLASQTITFKRNGSGSGPSGVSSRTQVADVQIEEQMMIECDGKQKLQYSATSTTWTGINMTVQGWILN